MTQQVNAATQVCAQDQTKDHHAHDHQAKDHHAQHHHAQDHHAKVDSLEQSLVLLASQDPMLQQVLIVAVPPGP